MFLFLASKKPTSFPSKKSPTRLTCCNIRSTAGCSHHAKAMSRRSKARSSDGCKMNFQNLGNDTSTCRVAKGTKVAIITWNKPNKIGETLYHQGTCQSLGLIFSCNKVIRTLSSRLLQVNCVMWFLSDKLRYTKFYKSFNLEKKIFIIHSSKTIDYWIILVCSCSNTICPWKGRTSDLSICL